MNKQDKLKKLDEAVLDRMLSLLESGETNLLPELGNAISYLKANEVVETKKTTDDAIEQRKKKLEEAKKRRNEQVQ